MNTTDRIFDLMEKKGLMQKDFATLIGVSKNKVSTWKTGSTESYTKHLPKIAEVLNTSVEYLLTGEEKEMPTVQDDGLSEAEQALMGLFRKLSPDQQEMVIRMVKAAADKL